MEQKPFIKLFSTINSNYFYDVNKNEIMAVNDDTWLILNQVMTNGESLKDYEMNKSEYSEINSLIQKGYLSGNRVKEIEHSNCGNIETTLERRMQKITLQLTQNCNFRCSYCHYTSNDGSQRKHSNKKMSLEMAKDAILFLKDHSMDSPEVYIGFYGGEPLLEFEMMKEIVCFAEDTFFGKKINYTITTNSVLLSDEIIEFFIKHQISVVISLDGPKEINDCNRVFAGSGQGTFDAIIKKVKYIYDKYPKFYKELSINMVMNPEHDFERIHSIFKDYPFLKKINIMSTVIDDVGALKKNSYSENYSKEVAYQEFLAYLSVMHRLPASKLYPTTARKVVGIQEIGKHFKERERLPEKAAPGGPCNPGEVRLMVTAEGDFIVCERVNEISDCMVIGNLKSGIDLNKVKALLNVAKVTEEKCIGCWAFSGCNLCAKYADQNGRLAKEARLKHCNRSRNNFLNILKEKALLMEAAEYYGQASM